MFEIKKPDQVAPGVAQGLPGEISVPSGLPAEVSSAYPAPVIDPRAKIAKFVARTPSMDLPPEHASMPPVSTLGDGSVKITLPEAIADLDAAREQSGGDPQGGKANLGRVTGRQLGRAAQPTYV